MLTVREARGLLLGADATAAGGTVLVMNAERRPDVAATLQADGHGHGEPRARPGNGGHCRKLILGR